MIRCAPFILVATLFIATSCEKQKPAPPPTETASQQTFQVQGVVLEVKPREKTVRIRHQEIPGYMPAMTMPFEVKNTNELTGLQSGDSVTFRMIVTEKDGWIDHVTKSGAVQVIDSATPSFIHIIPDVDLLQVGEALPDTKLTNELGQAINTGQFKGQAL